MKYFSRVILFVFFPVLGLSGFYYWHAVRHIDTLIVPYAELGDTVAMNGGQHGVVIILSDKKHMNSATRAARLIASVGQIAALVDLDAVFDRVRNASPDCLDQVTLLDVYAQHLQQTFQSDHFGKPVLIGFGSAGSYLELLLSQAPAGIFSAGISIQEQDSLLLPAALCGTASQQIAWQSAVVPVNLSAILNAATPWVNLSSDWQQWRRVLATMQPWSSPASAAGSDVRELPLVELPQQQGGTANYFVVIISGDGGWANIDKDIAGALGAQGIAVVGWNSLRYLWEPKNPDVMSADLARVIRYYQRSWGKANVVLVGFSLGADVLPFMVSRLPADVQQIVSGLVLLSPSQTVDFQFHISDWLHSQEGNPAALLPEMKKIDYVPVLCIYGVDDDKTLCQEMTTGEGTRIVQLPGDHHFDGDYDAVTQLLLSQFPVLH